MQGCSLILNSIGVVRVIFAGKMAGFHSVSVTHPSGICQSSGLWTVSAVSITAFKSGVPRKKRMLPHSIAAARKKIH
jgi:hypothetical protein